MKKILAIFLMVGVMVVAASCSGFVESSESFYPNTMSDETDHIVVEKSDRSEVLLEIDAVDKMTLINSALNEKDAMGGDNYALNRKYFDETYNIAYLDKVYDGELEILPDGTLDDWIENTFLKKSPKEQEAIPVMYQAVHELGISKDQLEALNDSRKELGQYMILSDEYINSLYIQDDADMKQALVNPRALYYDGEIYTWYELSTEATTASVISQIPQNVMNDYIDSIVDYLDASGIMSLEEIDQYIIDSVGNITE